MTREKGYERIGWEVSAGEKERRPSFLGWVFLAIPLFP
jgi:hypothetical protein